MASNQELKYDITVSVTVHNKTFYASEKDVSLPIDIEIQESLKDNIKRQIDAYLPIFEKQLNYVRRWADLRKYFIDKYNKTLIIKHIDDDGDRDEYYKYAIIEAETNEILFTNTRYHNPDTRTGHNELVDMMWEKYKDEFVE